MSQSLSSGLLGPILKDVSRSFYLTLSILPAPVRPQIGLAYLLARAADSIADTRLLPSHARAKTLLEFRKLLQNPQSQTVDSFMKSLAPILSIPGDHSPTTQAEHLLLQKIPDAFNLFRSLDSEDQKLVTEVVTELTVGMEMDLHRFPHDDKLAALHTFDELERYTYHVAGCVGPFWTRMCVRHLLSFHDWQLQKMCELGIRFGKALQWTNVLRDIPRDLQHGRCYLPTEDLHRFGLKPEDLCQPGMWPKLQPYYSQCLDHALRHYQAAWEYTQTIPASSIRVRLACIWPIWIGLETLSLLRHSGNPIDPADRIRISRKHVYRILLRSMATLFFPSLLNHHQQELVRKAS